MREIVLGKRKKKKVKMFDRLAYRFSGERASAIPVPPRTGTYVYVPLFWHTRT